MLQKIGNVLEESSLVLLADLSKLAEELAAHLNGKVLTAHFQLHPPLVGQEGVPDSARADAQV